MKKTIAFIFFLLAINACTKEEIEDPIIGEWQFRLANTFDEQFWNATIIITFNNDGTGTGVRVIEDSSSDSPAPKCPESSRRSTIEILLEGAEDMRKIKIEDKNGATANAALGAGVAKASSKEDTIVETRGRRESSLSAGSEVEL